MEEDNSFKEPSVFSNIIPSSTLSNEENLPGERRLALNTKQFWQKIEEEIIQVDDEKFVFPLDLSKKSIATKCFIAFLNLYCFCKAFLGRFKLEKLQILNMKTILIF